MSTLVEINELTPIEIKKYRRFGSRTYNRLVHLSKQVGYTPIIHINATPKGGGVAEMLKSEIPAERSLGLDSHWFTIKAPDRFFTVTKKIHNSLQGGYIKLTKTEKNIYLRTNSGIGKSLKKILKRFEGGAVVIHDPQPLSLINYIPPRFKTVLRLHIDLSSPTKTTLNFLSPYIKRFDEVVVSNNNYKKSLHGISNNINVIYPAIDPLTPRNRPMPLSTARKIVSMFSIDPRRPLLTQISRFDRWKDPIGVVGVYRLAKKEVADLQLSMAGFIVAADDPEAKTVFKEVERLADKDKDIHLFSNPRVLTSKKLSNDEFISALYTVSTVMIQKSLKEGFGLTMTEAMWKNKVVVAGKTSGSLVQIKDNINGFVARSTDEIAFKVVKALKDRRSRIRVGLRAHKSVEKKFLFPILVLSMLRIYSRLQKTSK